MPDGWRGLLRLSPGVRQVAKQHLCIVIRSIHAYIRECSTRLTQDRLHLLEERLRSAGPAAPSYVADMESYMERLREAGKREETGIPVELLYGREIDAALRCTQRVIAMYGKLLCAWPDMVEVANAWSDRVFEESRVR